MAVCEVCGNGIDPQVTLCKYCGSHQEVVHSQPLPFSKRHINLELGKPAVEVAMKRLLNELKRARLEKVQVMTLIHGYGSSGKGGAIRVECRKTLDYLKSRGEIGDYIPGEDFRRRVGSVKALLRRFPQLEGDKNLDCSNPGITLVVL